MQVENKDVCKIVKNCLLTFNRQQIELYHLTYLSPQLYRSTRALYLVLTQHRLENIQLSCYLYPSTRALNYIIVHIHTYHLAISEHKSSILSFNRAQIRIILLSIVIILAIFEHKSSLLSFNRALNFRALMRERPIVHSYHLSYIRAQEHRSTRALIFRERLLTKNSNGREIGYPEHEVLRITDFELHANSFATGEYDQTPLEGSCLLLNCQGKT